MSSSEEQLSDAPDAVQPEAPAKPKPKPKPRNRPADEREQSAQPASEPAEQENAPPSPAPRRRWVPRKLLAGTGAFFTSVVFHLVLLILLALIFVPEVVKQEIIPIVSKPVDIEEEEERLDNQILDESLTPSIEQAVSITPSSSEMPGSQGVVVGSVPPPESIRVPVGVKSDSEVVTVDDPYLDTPPSKVLIQDVPAGMLGDARAVVDDYQDAMDRITRELLTLLEKSRVCVIWSFDRSESMKDDQGEIRDRIERVYAELGLSGRSNGGALTTAVTSYGETFGVHTEEPTARVDLIRKAIASIPIDNSGKEMMCAAVAQSIAVHRRPAKGRQMVLILVTDETGEKEDNVVNLELAIAEAKAAGCIVYVLGREAVFGYPYAYMRWKHPGTDEIHWLPVDRGPETGFIEQLQTNGFRRRHDAFASGFGPYEQSRLARETGGVFFMLPSLETSIVRGENRRYELEAMRGYRPDLRSRATLAEENLNSLLRTRTNEVIASLNPWNEAVRPHVELRVHFSPDPETFVEQAAQERAKSIRYVDYLVKAENVFASEEMRYARSQEISPRWQANYDLLYAQILAYKVRNFEYAAYLDWFLKNPQVVPLTKSPNLKLVYWDIGTRKETLTGELTASMIEQSKVLFQEVIDKHPGTPWAARAQWELRRGFGVHLTPHYRAPYRNYTGPAIPIPKL